jgi:predicted proteasome-type protease
MSPNVQKTDKFSFEMKSRQPMGVDKVASFEKLTNFTKNSTLLESSN